MTSNPRAPLLPGVSQFEVDFVIPRAGIDLPLGIDPFLLFKSRDPLFTSLHSALVSALNAGLHAIQAERVEEARYLLTYPEVQEIGLGYSKQGKRGSGVGSHLTDLLIDAARATPDLATGVSHIEEMQLVSVGIGPDRVSDMAANVFKSFLIDYTQRQCELWNLPLTSGLPVGHVWDPDNGGWFDTYADLPVSPVNSAPLLFVPRRIVRALPWINYDDFLRLEFQPYLRARRGETNLRKLRKARKPVPREQPEKPVIVEITRREYERVRRFVAAREANAAEAQPSRDYLKDHEACPETDRLAVRLRAMRPGLPDAAEYQRLVLEILNTCFNPELIDGKLEVRTVDGTERRDVVFLNDSDRSFWQYVREQHSNFLVMFETKNKSEIGSVDLNQTAVYLGDRMGRFGIVVTRNAQSEANERKAFAIYNDSQPRKVIVVLSDNDLIMMLEMICRGRDPSVLVRDRYRTFRERVQ